MDDIPQGGAGGVPLHHDEPEPEQKQEKRPGRHTAPTVRAGTPVAEQKAEPEREEIPKEN
ncbi:hypothetical protein ACGFX4_09725 [Kitasatospora sp. NPDC048365]|uniref:hypothetical protein n=1 Tax=Kitasatospora sp. NPDC048365 TaxID=3364050 RepID=UPI0037141947